MIQFLKHHKVFAIVSAVIVAGVAVLAVASRPPATISTLKINVFGVPKGYKITVIPLGSAKLIAAFHGTHTTVRNVHAGSVLVFAQAPQNYTKNDMYVSTHRDYNLSGKQTLNVHFVHQYNVGVGDTVEGGPPGGGGGLSLIHITPHSTDGMYDAGSTVTISASDGGGLQFAWWSIANYMSGSVHTPDNAFTTASRKVTEKLNHSISVIGFFVGAWHRLPKTSKQGIVVRNMVPGQTAELLRKGKSPLMGHPIPNFGVLIPLPHGESVNGRILVTAPDGKTKVFESPFYRKLVSGDAFFY